MASKFFKLGKKATMFYDPASQKKIVGDQVVEFDDKDQTTTRFQERLSGGHILETDAPKKGKIKVEEDEDEDEGKEKTDLEKFEALTNAEMKKWLDDEYELTDADKAEIEAAKKKADLVAIYKRLEE